MKQKLLTIFILCAMIVTVGCGKAEQDKGAITGTPVPTQQPTITEPVEDATEGTSEEPTSGATEDKATIEDYYPLQADTEYVFAGEGNEYAAYKMYVDFIDAEKNRYQTRVNNGGTETVRVIEIKDGKLTVVAMVNECYYRDNILDQAGTKEEILLMEPLSKGTQWTLPDGRERYISGTEVEIKTPAGDFIAIEVTTKSEDGSTTMDYYAPQVGLVKEIFKSSEGDMEVSSTLSERNENKSFTQPLQVFYPDADEKIYTEQITLSFKTNDVTRTVIEDAIKQQVIKDSYLPLMSKNTAINSLYLGDDGIVYVDFSKEFVTEMNAGSGYEVLLLQSVTNTLGNYYGVQKVYITIDGKPYESGHILMKKGETFKVNMDNVKIE